jgi:Fe-S cluster biogenesis protein NfuA
MLTEEELVERKMALDKVMSLMRPAVQADGGDLILSGADYEKGIVQVELQGACTGCAFSGDTLQEGVERILKGRLPWVTEVLGGVAADP